MDALRKTLLAEGGRDGFDSYRVPGLAVTAAGTLLACCEGRIKEGDRRTLLLYRSTDDGATFAPRTVLAEPAPGQLLHNPMLLACRDGRVLLFWCSDYGHLYLRVSHDDGCTFGEARNLTGAIDGFRKEWPVTLWAIAPGHGVEMKNGTLVVPLWLSRGENAHLPACYACLYSTDGGETWLCSNVVPAANGIGDPTEASVAERSDGTQLDYLLLRGRRGGEPLGFPLLPDDRRQVHRGIRLHRVSFHLLQTFLAEKTVGFCLSAALHAIHPPAPLFLYSSYILQQFYHFVKGKAKIAFIFPSHFLQNHFPEKC